MKLRRLHAYGNLAWQLLTLIWKRWALRRRPGLQDFRSFYLPDRIVTFSAAEQKLLTEVSRCISCGLCDAVTPASFRPSLLPHQIRSVPDFTAAHLSVDRSIDLRAAEAICPNHVPLGRILAFIKEKSDEVTAARA